MYSPQAAPEGAPQNGHAAGAPAKGMAPQLRAGQRLANARTALGWSVEQAAERIKIRPEFVLALEAMNIKLLPGKAYAIAYLRSYAGVLGLPVDEVVEQFRRESALTREDATPQIHDPTSKPARERPWLAALALGIVAAGFIGWRAVIDTGDTDAKTAADAGAQIAAPAQPSRPVAPEADPSGEPFGLAAQRVEVRALVNAKIDVRAPNGTVFFEGVLPAGRAIRPDAGAGWTLHALDGGAFEVFLNGQSVGALGAAGAPVLGRRVDAIAAIALQG
jgi:transcriptional regulator with XRE-family HTH domain